MRHLITYVQRLCISDKVKSEEDWKPETSDEVEIGESDTGHIVTDHVNRVQNGIEDSAGPQSIDSLEENGGVVNEIESTQGEVIEQTTGYTEAEQKDIVNSETELYVPQDKHVDINPECSETDVRAGSYTDVTDIRKEYSESGNSVTRDKDPIDFEVQVKVEDSGNTTEISEGYEVDKIIKEEEPHSERVIEEDQGAIVLDEPHPEVSVEKDPVSPTDQSELRKSPTMESESKPPASCKFRYAKTIPTDSSSIIFYTSYNPVSKMTEYV